MQASIKSEFQLSEYEYKYLLRALQSRLGVEIIEDMACLAPERLAGVTDPWEAAAMRRISEIVASHVGVEKLYRSRETKCGESFVSEMV